MNQTPEMDEKKTSSPETAPIAATAEHNANFEENIRAIIRSGKPASVIRDDLDNYHANDIAEVLETLDTATRKRLYNILSLEMTAEIFTYLDEPAPYLHELGLDRAAAVLAEMDADEAVDILENLDPEEKEALIARMDQESKDDIHLIFSYDEEQIGSRMTTNYIVIPNNCTIKQAMRHLISQAEDNDNIDTIYVEDENGRYFGAIELKDLITAREYMKLEDIISTSYPYVYADERSSDCMEELIDYSEDSIPVLDRNHKIIGAITYEDIAEAIEKSPLESVEIRSVLTCEARHGVCAKCYGRNLATARMVQKGEVVGVIAAQSIGEPGTQLTLRTFHVGGVAGGSVVETNVVSKYEGRLEIEELRTIKGKNAQGEATNVVISRQSEIRIVDPKTEIVLYTHPLPYGATLFMTDGAEVKKGDLICEWDPYNAVIISEFEGKASYENVIEGVTYREERDEQTGLSEKVVIESKDKTKNPVIKIINREGEEVKSYNLPVSAHVVVKDNAKIHAGDILIKIPRAVGKSGGDITGGLPRVTELFEARNPSNPAIVSEIDGEVSFGKIKRGNREIVITSKQGDVKRYLVPLSRQIIVQENDYVKAGSPLSDGAITPSDILRILGPTKVQEYIVNEVQEVYRMQGVKINDKHFEVIVRQMMSKVQIEDPGDTRFFEDQIVDKWEFMDVNDALYDKVVVTDAGDSTSVQPGQIISLRKLRDENSSLKRKDMRQVQVRDIVPATSNQVLQGITRAALQTSSFISAASFQETTKVLNEAAIQGKVDPLENLKENVICGHLIPGGTGLREYDDLLVGLKSDVENLTAAAQ